MSDQGYLPYGLYMNGDPQSWIPPRGKTLAWMRKEWHKPMVCRVEDLNPYMNVIGLYWKMTGIAKELGR